MAGGLRIAREGLHITDVSRDEVLRYLGYRGQELTEAIDSRIDRVTERCLAMSRPRMCVASYGVRNASEDAIELEGAILRLTGHDIAAHLADAREVVLFAVTLGIDIDRELRRLSLTDTFEQVIFDSVATALVERAADAANARIRAYACEQNAYTSWRFSPGYGDLPLAVQGEFLRTLDATRQLGIALTPSNLMIPTKSVTAIVGIHPTPQPGLETSCAVCSLADFCTLRQLGRTCHG